MMKIPLVVWCFTAALLLKPNYSSANSSATASELLNVILENSTYFDKELNSDRNISNESLFTNNGDNISSNTNEECRAGNCERKLNLSLSASSSSSSKILWNFVSIPKSTTEYSVSENDEEEGYSTSPGVPHNTNHHENHSSVHNSSLHSNDNELDSKIDFNIDYVLHLGGVTDSNPMTPSIPFGINSTNSSEFGEDYIDFMNSTANFKNLTDSTTLAPLSTLIPADDELDFTTYLSNPFDSNESELSAEEINYHVFENSTIKLSDSEENTTLYSDKYDNGNSTTVFGDAEIPTESQVHEDLRRNSGALETANINSERATTETSFSEEFVTSNAEYNTPMTHNFKMSTESEIPLSTDALIDPISVISTYSSITTLLRSREETSTGENLSIATEENLNSMVDTALPTESSITEPDVKNELGVNLDSNDATSTENGLYVRSQTSEVTEETPSTTDKLLLGEKTSVVTLKSTEVDEFFTISQEKAPTSYSSIPSSVQDLPELYRSDDSDGNFSEGPNPISSHDVPLSEILTKDLSSITSTESSYKENVSSNMPDQLSTILPLYDDEDINEVHLRSSAVTFMGTTYHSNNLNEVNNYLSSMQTNHDTTSLHSKSAETSTPSQISTSPSTPLQASSSPPTPISVTESSFVAGIDVTAESFNFNLTEKDISSVTTDGNALVTSEHFNEHFSSVLMTSEIQMENTEIAFSTSTTVVVIDSAPVSVSVTDGNFETAQTPVDGHDFSEIPSGITKEKSENTWNSFETKTEPSIVESQVNTDATSAATDFDTVHISDTLAEDTTVSYSSSNEVSVVATAETHREGKHIPFSSTLVKSTTVQPVMHNMTIKIFSDQPEPTATEKTFGYFIYNQLKPEELTSEERLNIIETFIKLPDKLYSSEELNQKILIVHLWLLHAVADEYKNASLQSLSESEDKELDEVEFENLPQILYIEPSPKINSPNITLTFVVNNKWRNETYAVDLIVTILNLHTEDLKHLVEIEEIFIYHNMSVENKDLFSVIIAKYGIVLLSTCVITVIMIVLLICVVIYYRRKNRHSAHCLTDDKLHRNMQEAMGIDLNPAVIILQDEIREKAALNGNKISSLDDDEGWLAPIGDVPVAEDNNAPYVQDTKL